MSILSPLEWNEKVRGVIVAQSTSPDLRGRHEISIEHDYCVVTALIWYRNRKAIEVMFGIGPEAETTASVSAPNHGYFTHDAGLSRGTSTSAFEDYCKGGLAAVKLVDAVMAEMSNHICPIPSGSY